MNAVYRPYFSRGRGSPDLPDAQLRDREERHPREGVVHRGAEAAGAGEVTGGDEQATQKEPTMDRRDLMRLVPAGAMLGVSRAAGRSSGGEQAEPGEAAGSPRDFLR